MMSCLLLTNGFKALPNEWKKCVNLQSDWRKTRVNLANVLKCEILVNVFELPLYYWIHFWVNTIMNVTKPLIAPSYGLNSSTTVLLQGWLWH